MQTRDNPPRSPATIFLPLNIIIPNSFLHGEGRQRRACAGGRVVTAPQDVIVPSSDEQRENTLSTRLLPARSHVVFDVEAGMIVPSLLQGTIQGMPEVLERIGCVPDRYPS